ncbi:MAG: hypothetical protein KDC26_00765 [Armatimonadetes bacterium]|nr:hypothetical protein [Armatimonadota bacterium]
MRDIVLKKSMFLFALAGVYAFGSVAATAQSAPQARRGSAETALVGIALFDPGTKVISKFGSPDEIQALNVGGANAGGGGGAGAPGGAPGGGRPGGGGGGLPSVNPDAGMGQVPPNWIGDPFNDNTNAWRVQEGGERAGGGGGGAARPASGPGGGGGGGNAGGGGGGSVTQGNNQKVIYTRWVYKRNNSKYAFVFDKFNRVIQIEAIGMKNSSVRTRRGITFGSSFGSVIKAYNAPDGYEISGDNIVVRFLVNDRVAFRLSRLDAKKPHVVTGVVVAAGKT